MALILMMMNLPLTELPEPMISPKDVLDFWFDPETKSLWFQPTDAFDDSCRQQFGAAIEDAGHGKLDDWQGTPEGSLALLILLDQLTRNVYRGKAQAFAHDAKALAVACNALDAGHDAATEKDRRMFFYLPLEHSEDSADQARSVALFEKLGLPEPLDYAIRHQVIIDRFGRFPHRNAILGRECTAEELAFLKEPRSSF